MVHSFSAKPFLTKKRIVGAAPEADGDVSLVDGDLGRRMDELPEEGSGRLLLVPVCDGLREHAVEGCRHDGELEVDIDLEGDGGRECIHVEHVDGLGDGVLDDHAPGIAVDQSGRRFLFLVGDQQGRLLMAEVGDRDLAHGARIAGKGDGALEDARVPVGPADIVEGDPFPFSAGGGLNGVHDPGGAAPERDEVNAVVVEPGEVGIGGQRGVEDQFAGPVAGVLLPVFGEAQDLVALGGLPDRGVDMAEQAGLVVADDEGEDPLLAPRPLRDVVFLGQRVIAVIGNGMKVEIETGPAGDARRRVRHRTSRASARAGTGDRYGNCIRSAWRTWERH